MTTKLYQILSMLLLFSVTLYAKPLQSSFVKGFSDDSCQDQNKGSNIQNGVTCFQFDAGTLSYSVGTPGNYDLCNSNGCKDCDENIRVESNTCYKNDPSQGTSDYKSLKYLS